MAERKELIVFIGNCQVRSLEMTLRRLPSFAAQYDTLYFRRVLMDSRPVTAEFRWSAVTLGQILGDSQYRLRLVVNQTTLEWGSDKLDPDSLAQGVEVVWQPNCLLPYLWPMATYGEKSPIDDPAVRRRFPDTILDKRVLALKAQGVGRENLLDAYFANDVVADYRLDRLKRLTEIKSADADKRSTYALFPFIAETLQTQQAFRTANHPDGVVMAEIMRQLAAHSTAIGDLDGLEATIQKQRTTAPLTIGWLEAPIHPAVIEHFGLTWARGKTFSFWGLAQLTFEQYLMRIYDLDYDQEIWLAKDKAAAGDLKEAIRLVESAIAKKPDVESFRTQLSRYKRTAVAEKLASIKPW